MSVAELKYKIFDKTYDLKYCDLRLIFKYNAEYLGNFEFDLNCISIGELESGYEDDDQLTFYPNVLKLGFEDVNRWNYEYLKQVIESYPDYENYEVTQFELWYNKKGEQSRKVFLGSVDGQSLKYTERKRILEFDLVDITQSLKTKTTDLTGVGGTDKWAFPYYIHTIYKSIFPDLNYNVTNDINVFKQPNYKGIYFKHNWVFKGDVSGALKSFENPEQWNDIWFLGNTILNDLNNYSTMTDVLKAIAQQFGLVIGCEEPNKIHVLKRFVKPSWAESIAIDIKNYLINDYTKEIWLKNVIAVRNSITYQGQGGSPPVTVGDYRPNPNDSTKPKNLDTLLEVTTPFATGNIYGIIYFPNPNMPYGIETADICFDRDINMQSYIEWVIAELYLKAREVARDKFEFELMGTDYSMADYYKLHQEGTPLKIMRPLTIKKDLIKNKTKITALEIGLNV